MMSISLAHESKYVIIYDALYILTTVLFKISLAIFFLRIVVISWQRHLIYIATGIYTIYSTVFILIITFRCGTPSDLLINAFKGRCISDAAIMPLVYTSGVLNAAVDWIFAVFPVLILWNSNMPRKAKISAGVLLSMGESAGVSSKGEFTLIQSHCRLSRQHSIHYPHPISWWIVSRFSFLRTCDRCRLIVYD